MTRGVPQTASTCRRKEIAHKGKGDVPRKRRAYFKPPGPRTEVDEGLSALTTTTAPAPALPAPPTASTVEVGASSSQPNAPPTSSIAEVGASSSQPNNPQGPNVSELIPNFEDHISYRILKGEERNFKHHNHTKKLSKWICPPFIAEKVQRAGLMPLVSHSYSAIDGNLLRVFVERWHPTTCTFHLPVGEMTITLDDVSSLIGLPVVGRAVSAGRLRRSHITGVQYVSTMLNVRPDSQKDMGNGERTVKLDWLYKTFRSVTAKNSEEKRLYATRAYLLYLLGCTIFADKTGMLVSVEWLQFLENVDTIGECAWGSVCLCSLYRQLSKASKGSTAQLSGYLTLFQAWINEHFPVFTPTYVQDFEGYLANRWLYPKKSQGDVERVRHLHLLVDELDLEKVFWYPYYELRERFPMPESTLFNGMLCCMDFLEPYHPDRVLRQFGRVQDIPGRPYMSKAMAKKYMQRDTSQTAFVPFYDRLFDRWQEFCLDDVARSTPVVDGQSNMSPVYMPLYRDRTIIRLSAAQASRPHAPRSRARLQQYDVGSDPPHSREMKILDMANETLTSIRDMDSGVAYDAMFTTLKEIVALFDTKSTDQATSSVPPQTSSAPPSSPPSSLVPPPTKTLAPPADPPKNVYQKRQKTKK